LPLTGPGRVAIPAVNAPDLQKEAAKQLAAKRKA
jgi:limonene 1,2-monooxygenase